MASSVSAMTGAVANMAALEAEFQANWKSLDVMSAGQRPNLIVTTDLAAGETLRLFIRSATHGGTPIWSLHEDGPYTIPAKFCGAPAEWASMSYQVLDEWSGFVIHTSASATVRLSTSFNG